MPKSKSQNNVTLFPFLAVLVCTMGALILLLLVTTRRIKKQQTNSAIALSAENAAAQIDGVENPNENPTEPSDFTAQSRDTNNLDALESPFETTLFDHTLTENSAAESTQTLGDRQPPQAILQSPQSDLSADAGDQSEQRFRELMSEIEEHDQQIQSVRQQIADAETQLDIQSETARQEQDIAAELRDLKERQRELESQEKAQLAQLRQLADQLDAKSALTTEIQDVLQQRESALISLRKLAQASIRAEASGREKTILEFANSTGTTRNPIIIELNSDRCTFLPDDVSFSLAELRSCPRNDNPLISGIFASHQAHQSQFSTATPYVLLLVRPNSSKCFHSVRIRLMTSGIHFGYELIGQDQDVATGERNQQAARDIQHAIVKTLQKYTEFAEYQSLANNLLKERKPAAVPKSGFRLLPNGDVAFGDESGAGDGTFFAGNERLPDRATKFSQIPSPSVIPPLDARKSSDATGNTEPNAASEQEQIYPNPFLAAIDERRASRDSTSGKAGSQANPEAFANFDAFANSNRSDNASIPNGTFKSEAFAANNPFANDSQSNGELANHSLLNNQNLTAENLSESTDFLANSDAIVDESWSTENAKPATEKSASESNFLTPIDPSQSIHTAQEPPFAETALPPKIAELIAKNSVHSFDNQNTQNTVEQQSLLSFDGVQQPTDWPQTEVANSVAESRPVESAALSGGQGFSQSSLVEEFLARAAREHANQQPNPHLLELLNRSLQQQKFQEDNFQPALSTPPTEFKTASPHVAFQSLVPALRPSSENPEETPFGNVPSKRSETSETTVNSAWQTSETNSSATVDSVQSKSLAPPTDIEESPKRPESSQTGSKQNPWSVFEHTQSTPDHPEVPTLIVVKVGHDSIRFGNEPAIKITPDIKTMLREARSAIHSAAGVGVSKDMVIRPQLRYEVQPGAEKLMQILQPQLENAGFPTVERSGTNGVDATEQSNGPFANPAIPMPVNPRKRGSGGLSL